uniref:ATP synthase F0 subunit 8 n=1 Tax=Chrysaora quinquecirrha TaxID=6148 RepID=A0A7U1BFG6_CHRQI|nr:ATP synthase F0 subunit 8 [Chrysaora quinquecirrha]
MPQLDFITYLNQYIWTIMILSACIIIMCVTLLPSLKYCLESRLSESVTFSYTKQHEFTAYKKLLEQ